MRMFVDPMAVYLHRDSIDFRVGIGGLATRVEQKMALSPLTGALFAFTNRTRDRVKILYWARPALRCGSSAWRRHDLPGPARSPMRCGRSQKTSFSGCSRATTARS